MASRKAVGTHGTDTERSQAADASEGSGRVKHPFVPDGMLYTITIGQGDTAKTIRFTCDASTPKSVRPIVRTIRQLLAPKRSGVEIT